MVVAEPREWVFRLCRVMSGWNDGTFVRSGDNRSTLSGHLRSKVASSCLRIQGVLSTRRCSSSTRVIGCRQAFHLWPCLCRSGSWTRWRSPRLVKCCSGRKPWPHHCWTLRQSHLYEVSGPSPTFCSPANSIRTHGRAGPPDESVHVGPEEHCVKCEGHRICCHNADSGVCV